MYEGIFLTQPFKLSTSLDLLWFISFLKLNTDNLNKQHIVSESMYDRVSKLLSQRTSPISTERDNPREIILAVQHCIIKVTCPYLKHLNSRMFQCIFYHLFSGLISIIFLFLQKSNVKFVKTVSTWFQPHAKIKCQALS